jgi:4-hydroxythreonine-4-phosphate dehydrogenase
MKPIIAITMGDPSGIGPEIIVKALVSRKVHRVCRPVVVGLPEVFQREIRRGRRTLRLQPVHTPIAARPSTKTLSILPCGPAGPAAPPHDRPGRETGLAALEAIRTAVRLTLSGEARAIATAPVSKEALAAAGCLYPGHTELLAALTRSREVGMLMVAPPLRILLVTTHLALKDLPRALTSARILGAIRLADRSARRVFCIRRPRIAVAALNPHAGEHGLFGEEERNRIAPAVRKAVREGIRVSGPHPADTLLVRAARGEQDMIVALYHDQAMIPIKLLGFGRAVNLTVGLPFIRTSPDHGMAHDIAGRGSADPGSMIEAIRLAARLAANDP